MYDFTVLVFPGAFASSVAATLDILGTAAILAQRRGLAVPRWRVCGPQPGLSTLGQGMLLQVDALTTDVEDNSCWVIPGLGISDFDVLRQRLEEDVVLQTLASAEGTCESRQGDCRLMLGGLSPACRRVAHGATGDDFLVARPLAVEHGA